MKTNVKARTVVIVVTILLCIYFIVDFPRSKADLVRNFQIISGSGWISRAAATWCCRFRCRMP